MLPTGYKVVPYYDRTGLVETTLHTVIENLTIGMALVFIVLIFFLGNLRAAIIAAINIPLALCGAFTLMHVERYAGQSDFAGRDRFRHHHRYHRHRDGEHRAASDRG